MESTYAYARQHVRLQGMLLMANGDDIMETEKQSATDSRFSTCRDSIECFLRGRCLRHKHLVLTTYRLLPYYLLPYYLTTYRLADLNIAQLRLFCYFYKLREWYCLCAVRPR